MGTINVLVPTAEVRTHEIEMVQRPADLNGKTIGFLWNRKPSGNILLKKLEEWLKGEFQLRGTWMGEKALSSSEAPPEVIDEFAARSDLVILAIGD